MCFMSVGDEGKATNYNWREQQLLCYQCVVMSGGNGTTGQYKGTYILVENQHGCNSSCEGIHGQELLYQYLR
ncbi:hypothetical protein E2C01_060723 [Portunus trituberculatus]|uniref:Uncharacterized protein n=1 Tax=Portunus trituberculatus TaxID=210409 RepID=A0A5B7HCX6_PORTR|nr:hypothetical protein [Portunus trituberculatus]